MGSITVIPTSLTSAVDNVTLEVSSGKVQVKDGAISSDKINSAVLNPITEEDGAYTHTGDTNDTTLRTYTIGGGFTGERAITLSYEMNKDGSYVTNTRIFVNSKIVNMRGNTVDSTYQTIPSGESATQQKNNIVNTTLMVIDTDVITIVGNVANALGTVSISNIKIFCNDTNVTATGS